MAAGKSGSGKRISIKLSAQQQQQIKQATGKNAAALELTVEELEERIAPISPRDAASGQS